MDWRLFWILIALWLLVMAAFVTDVRAQDFAERQVRVGIVPGGPVERLELRSDQGVLAECEVDPVCNLEPCILRCVLPPWANGTLWAVAYGPGGESVRSNVRRVDHYPTFYERADANGDGLVNVNDILFVHRAVFAADPR